MTRSQLITKVANDTNMTSAEVEKVMDGIFGTIGDVLKSGDKAEAAELAWKLHDYGYKIYGTPGTAKYLNSEMVPCSVVRQMSGARPNVIDLLESGLVDYIISTSPHGRDPHRDSVKFRRKATELSIPTITAMDTARVLVDALRGDHDISQMELVDIANLHREAASGK